MTHDQRVLSAVSLRGNATATQIVTDLDLSLDEVERSLRRLTRLGYVHASGTTIPFPVRWIAVYSISTSGRQVLADEKVA